jgi:hypothetical protein
MPERMAAVPNFSRIQLAIAATAVTLILSGCSNSGTSLTGTDAAKLPVASAAEIQKATAALNARSLGKSAPPVVQQANSVP